MIDCELIDKEFSERLKGMDWHRQSYDFTFIQLDGNYTSHELRIIADTLDEFKTRVDRESKNMV